jgi:hypothetical protein
MKTVFRCLILALIVSPLVLNSSLLLAKGRKGPPKGFEKGEKKGWEADVPPGWSHGEKKGWDGESMPPGLMKKEE